MAGVKGRSGPPGNLHAAKSGIQSWLRRRALPHEKQHVAKLVEGYRDGLIACKGGSGTVTEVELALIENCAKAFGACLLILEEAAARGLVRSQGDSWDLSPGFTRLQGFLGIEARGLAILGLGRRQKGVNDLRTLLNDAASDEDEETGQ